MGLLSSRISLTRYRVNGKLEASVNETVYQKLKEHAIPTIEDEVSETVVGWSSFENPYIPDFEGLSFVYGDQMVFSLRIDKKRVPPKLIKKHYTLELARRLEETGLPFLSGNEKKALKEHVVETLTRRIPATPDVFDLTWNYQEASLWFFSTQKSANEILESHFIKSFGLHLIRIFPYTNADLTAGLSGAERDLLMKLSPDNSEE